MKTVGEILSKSVAFLTERKAERPRRSAEELLASAIGLKRIDLYMQFDRPLIEAELQRLRSALLRRAAGEPLEYIQQSVEFYHCKIEVSPDVLIPRQETEILVDLALKRIGNAGVLWDLCTGSGCIGLAIKKARPGLSVTLSDLCPKALAVAQKNGESNQIDVALCQGDLLEPFFGQRADFVTCNPPYIARSELEGLEESVKAFEPHRALIGGESGLEFYERLARELPAHLAKGALVFLEIGKEQGARVHEIFSAPFWVQKKLLKDWSGHDRFFFLESE